MVPGNETSMQFENAKSVKQVEEQYPYLIAATIGINFLIMVPNVYVIVVILYKPSLRKNSHNILVLSLGICDIVTGLGMAFATETNWNIDKFKDIHVCLGAYTMIFIPHSASFLHQLLICIERIMAFKCIRGNSMFKFKHILLYVFLIWLASITMGIIPSVLWQRTQHGSSLCEVTIAHDTSRQRIFYTAGYFLIVYILAMAFHGYLVFLVTRAAINRRRQLDPISIHRITTPVFLTIAPIVTAVAPITSISPDFSKFRHSHLNVVQISSAPETSTSIMKHEAENNKLKRQGVVGGRSSHVRFHVVENSELNQKVTPHHTTEFVGNTSTDVISREDKRRRKLTLPSNAITSHQKKVSSTSNPKRKQSAAQQSVTDRQKRASASMILNVCTLTVCCLPFYIVLLLEPKEDDYSKNIRKLCLFYLWCLNSAINPIIYAGSIKELRDMLPCRKKRTMS